LAQSRSRIPGAELLAGLMPRREMLTRRLSRTGYRVSLGSYALASVAVAAASTFIEIEFMRMPLLVGLVGGIGAGIGLPHAFVGYLIGRRTRAFLAAFPEAVELIVRGIKSGLPVSEEIAAVGREIADPVGYEFRQISDGLRFGQTLEEAMWDAAKRLEIADFNFFVVSLAVQRETGGNLAETLENLSDVLRKRRQMKLKVRAMSSEARASALIIGSLPFVMLGILLLLAPAYIGLLFTDPRGQLVIVGAGVLMLGGVLVMAKMVRFEI
ncbi:MAG: type II secretion system F family protein, partial [Rhodospirillales bacterium]